MSTFRVVTQLSLVLLVACSGASIDPAASKRPAPLVTVAPVAIRSVFVEARALVELRPVGQADVRAKTLGYLDAIFVDRGDKVKKGQLLAVIRPSELPKQHAAAEGALKQSQAALELARANHRRAVQLAPTHFISEQELQHAAADLASSEAAYVTAQAQLEVQAIRLDEARIYSPLDGIVSQRFLDPGALVGPTGSVAGGAIVTVAQVNTMRVFMPVSERLAARVTTGMKAHVELDALPGQSFQGKVARLAPNYDPVTRTLEAEVYLANPGGDLHPGMAGHGAIVLETHAGALTIPASALQFRADHQVVFVHREGRVHQRQVETAVDGGDWLEVSGGLSTGEEVVSMGTDTLADGAEVRVVRQIASTASVPSSMRSQLGRVDK